MTDFIPRGSIVRQIWGNPDMALLVFAGCSAEFALNRAVDWLFFTGKLPGDPLGRLFDTIGYAQQIIFADEVTAALTLERIRSIHEAVERQRGSVIPQWAHRNVLYMLVDYSERVHELVARPLTRDERKELWTVFHRIGVGLGISGLPGSYSAWRVDRGRHMRRDLIRSSGTDTLYAKYREQLGPWRYRLLLRVQAVLLPEYVRRLLGFKSAEWLRAVLCFYPIMVRARLRAVHHWLLIPSAYLRAVRELDRKSQRESSSRGPQVPSRTDSAPDGRRNEPSISRFKRSIAARRVPT